MYFHLTDLLFFLTLSPKSWSPVRPMNYLRLRFCHGKGAQERNHDGGGDLPLLEDYPKDALSLPTESPDSRLQTWERMEICSLGFGTVDSGSHEKPARVVKETLH